MPTPRKHPTGAARQAAYRARQAAARDRERTAKGLPAAPPIPTMPSEARWRALIEQARTALETARNEMEGYVDERSEAWQEGERGEAMRERIDALDSVLSDIEELE